MVRVNFAEVEPFEQLPKGRYHVIVTDGEVNQTSETSEHPDNDYWRVAYTVQDGPKKGKREWDNLMLPPYTPYGLFNLLRATVGQHPWSEEDLDGEADVDVELDDLIDLELVISVRPQRGNDEYNEVSRYYPYDPEEWETEEDDLLPG